MTNNLISVVICSFCGASFLDIQQTPDEEPEEEAYPVMKSILAYVPAGALTTPRGRLGEAGQNSRCPWLALPSGVETAVAGIQSLKSTTIKVIRVAFPVAATVH